MNEVRFQFGPLAGPSGLDAPYRFARRELRESSTLAGFDRDGVEADSFAEAWPADRIFRFLVSQGLASAVRESSEGVRAVAGLSESLRSERRSAVGATVLWKNLREKLAGAFSRHGLPVIWLKGADLAWRIYPEAEDRPMVDLDLLIRTEDLPAADVLLSEEGCPLIGGIPFNDPALSASINQFVYAATADRSSGLTVELHVDLAPIGKYRFPLEEVWREAVPCLDLPPGNFRMADWQIPPYLAAHAAQNGYVSRLASIRDVVLLRRAAPPEWKEESDFARRSLAGTAWRITCDLSTLLFGAPGREDQQESMGWRESWLRRRIGKTLMTCTDDLGRSALPSHSLSNLFSIDSAPAAMVYAARSVVRGAGKKLGAGKVRRA